MVASKKRVYASTTLTAESHQLPDTKKRVVLDELIKTPTIVSTQISYVDTKKPKSRLNQQVALPLVIVSANSDDTDKFLIHGSFNYKHLHFMEIEEKRRPLPNYMDTIQNDITSSMREILVDWLVEVAEEYKLVSDTIYLTVSYIDRFLSSNALNRNNLQTFGASCLLVASRYDEISPLHVEDCCYVTDNICTKEQVVNMERDILSLLNFELGTPTAKTFLRIFTKAAHDHEKSESPDLQFEFLGCYLAELSLLDYQCVRFLPSMVAASAIFLSRFTIEPEVHPWSLELQQYSGYRPSDLEECVLAIHDLQLSKSGSSLRAIRDKYMQHKLKCVATLSSPSEIPARYFQAIGE